jgi:hypothetical protein
MGFLDVLAKEYKNITQILQQGFDYDSTSEKYQIRKERRFKASIPLE